MCKAMEDMRNEAAIQAVEARDREIIAMLLRKDWSVEKIHSEMEYPMEQILSVKEELDRLLVEA